MSIKDVGFASLFHVWKIILPTELQYKSMWYHTVLSHIFRKTNSISQQILVDITPMEKRASFQKGVLFCRKCANTEKKIKLKICSSSPIFIKGFLPTKYFVIPFKFFLCLFNNFSGRSKRYCFLEAPQDPNFSEKCCIT